MCAAVKTDLPPRSSTHLVRTRALSLARAVTRTHVPLTDLSKRPFYSGASNCAVAHRPNAFDGGMALAGSTVHRQCSERHMAAPSDHRARRRTASVASRVSRRRVSAGLRQSSLSAEIGERLDPAPVARLPGAAMRFRSILPGLREPHAVAKLAFGSRRSRNDLGALARAAASQGYGLCLLSTLRLSVCAVLSVASMLLRRPRFLSPGYASGRPRTA